LVEKNPGYSPGGIVVIGTGHEIKR